MEPRIHDGRRVGISPTAKQRHNAVEY